MEFRILGPLEVLDDGAPVPLGTLKERVVLAVLLLHANEVVSRERLVDELWGPAPPPTARKAISVYLSKLRKTLARDGRDSITAAGAGYRLSVDPERLDSARAQRLVAEARARIAGGDVGGAGRLLQDALALWRGPTLAGLSLEAQGRDEVARLDELRLGAVLDRIDCDLAQGRHEEVAGELQVLVGEHPLRERLRAQQMLALYRSDRQADALEAFQQARRALVDELGIDPSESLQRLQHAILRHDPALELPGGTAAANGSVAAPTVAAAPAPSRPRRLRALTAAVVLAAGVAAGAVTLLSSRGAPHEAAASPPRQVTPNSLVRVDPASGKVVAVAPMGIEPGPMALSAGTLLVVNRGDRTISRIDLRSHHAAPPFAVGTDAVDVAADGEGNAWVAAGSPRVTWILHPAAGRGTAAVPLETATFGVPLPGAGAEAYGAGYVWVIPGPRTSSAGNDRVALIDVRTRKVAAAIPVGRETTAIAYGYGAAWIGAYDRRTSTASLAVVRPGSTTPELVRLEHGDGWGPLAVAVGAGDVWVLTSAGLVLGIDPETQRVVHRISVAARQPMFLAVGGRFVWTANLVGYSLSQIDPRQDRVVRTVRLGTYASIPCGLAATGDAVWLAIGDAYCDGENR
jgi:DNA-binding SARP family transcriptional activator/DNA-binding beta-propeller fold protein YncE